MYIDDKSRLKNFYILITYDFLTFVKRWYDSNAILYTILVLQKKGQVRFLVWSAQYLED